jgi:hypothetical protein
MSAVGHPLRPQDGKRIRSSLRGPPLNFFSVAFGTVFLVSAAALRLGLIQHSTFVIVGSSALALVALISTTYFLWNRVGWIEVDVDASSVFVHTNELEHCISLNKNLEFVEGRNAEYQSIAFRQGRRLSFRYRNESAEDEERWKSLPRVSDKIVPSLLVSSAVGRTMHQLVRERIIAPRIGYAEAALFLSLAFSSARENAGAELPN